MQLPIEHNLLRHYLRNAYFITGTAYAGKSTMVRMLAERYDMIHCGENYHDVFPTSAMDPALQPNLCYFDTMSGWEEFLSRTPEEYARWIDGTSREAAQIELLELIQRAASGKKLIVDTNIPLEWLHLIAAHDHVAVMLSPQAMSVARFFDRSDPEKQFLLSQLQQFPDPDAALENFRNCLAAINSPECYAAYANSGFFTLVREDAEADTREETLARLAAHFGLSDSKED